jgi:hypothetical protein
LQRPRWALDQQQLLLRQVGIPLLLLLLLLRISGSMHRAVAGMTVD